jgi:hypothetical protein
MIDPSLFVGDEIRGNIWDAMNVSVVSHRISRINGESSFIDSIESFPMKVNTFMMCCAV